MKNEDIYDSWEDTQRGKYEGIFLMIREFRNIFHGKKVLDVGGGPGYFELFLREKGIEAKITNIDPSRNYEKNVDVLTRAEDFQTKEKYDVMVCIDALHLIKNRNFLKYLKKGGYFLAAMFFSDDNFDERKELLRDACEDMEIIEEFSLQGKEKEHVILARKTRDY